MAYSIIHIIYNPNSTGDGKENAKNLAKELVKFYPKIEVKLHKTEYAGHAKNMAYEFSSNSRNPLIISCSGDGGYNEVINGAIEAQKEGASPICAVMASGNANDHSRTLQNKTLIESIKAEKVTNIDLLKMTIQNTKLEKSVYAHSYIGLGLTPVVATELNKTDLNAIKEMWIVIKTFYKYRPFKIKYKNKILNLDSIIFANISDMAKFLTVSKNSKADDGLFEVVIFEHGNKSRLIKNLAKATIGGIKAPKKKKSYEFRVLKNMPAQLDGEVIKITKNSSVLVTSEHQLLRTII
jgi:diacylglycerol kinase family enzyme